MRKLSFNKWIIIGFIFIAAIIILLMLRISLYYTKEGVQPLLICSSFSAILLLSLIICYTIVVCKKMKIDTESETQATTFSQKKDWEQFQYNLYREVNEKRFEYEKEKQEKQFEYEKEKWLYEKIEAIAKEFNKEKLPENEIKAIKDEIEKLKKQNEAQLRVKITKEDKTENN